MAAISSIPLPPLPKTLNSNITRKLPLSFVKSNSFPTFRICRIQAAQSSSSTGITEEEQRRNEESMSIDNLKSFVKLNLGKWNGTFYQYDSHGKLMQEVTTKLSDMILRRNGQSTKSRKLICLLWTSTNSLQIGFFPKERAFSLRYQTAGMLEYVLRQGVLGEDDTGEESPKNLKIPSRRPSIVCENCLYSHEKDMRARVFHILDPHGVLEMLLIFLEERGDGFPHLPSPDSEESPSRITPFLGRWKGHSITKRSGVYGATITESDTVALLDINDKNQLIQDITTTSIGDNVTTNVHWTGTISDSLVTFDGGFQMTLLPGGMYMGCPCNVAKSVAESKSFHLEFCWMDSPGKRQRLVRTYDVEGLAVSSTYISETKV